MTATLDQPRATSYAHDGRYYDHGRTGADDTVQFAEIRPAARRGQVPPRIDQLRFWIGALLAAAVAAILGGLGVVVAGTLLHAPVLVGGVAVSGVTYGVVAAAISLAVAGLYDAMLQVAPHPSVYFAWLVVAGALVAAVLPFTTGVALVSAAAFAAVNLLVGLVVLCLVPMAVASSSR